MNNNAGCNESCWVFCCRVIMLYVFTFAAASAAAASSGHLSSFFVFVHMSGIVTLSIRGDRLCHRSERCVDPCKRQAWDCAHDSIWSIHSGHDCRRPLSRGHVPWPLRRPRHWPCRQRRSPASARYADQ